MLALMFRAAPLSRERERLAGLSAALESFAPVWLASLRRLFGIGGDPPWAPLSPGYLREKIAAGYPANILVRTGALRDSIRVAPQGPYLAATAAAPHAAAHQYGDPSRNLPARPFLVMLPDDLRALEEIIAAHIAGDER